MATPKKDEETGQGRTVILPNKQKRVDYIRDEYYGKGKKRGDIKTAINEMLTKAKREGEHIPYQIVFAATKTKEDPRVAQEKRKVEAAKAKDIKEKKEAAEAKKEAAKKK